MCYVPIILFIASILSVFCFEFSNTEWVCYHICLVWAKWVETVTHMFREKETVFRLMFTLYKITERLEVDGYRFSSIGYADMRGR